MQEYIDYEDSCEDEPSTWTTEGFRKYFLETYWKVHRVGGAVSWTLKETVLMKTMLEEFNKDDLMDLIAYWHTHNKSSVACRFVDFYSDRVNIFHQMKKVSSDYTWE